MGDSRVVLPSQGDLDNGYVALARTASGKVYRKQILKMNESFIHPANKAQKIKIDSAFAQKLVDNFKAGYCDIVQFPTVNSKNQHVEDPGSNLGEVIDLTYDDTGVYAYIDARKNADDIGKTFLGASAMLHLNYEDKKTGNLVGPTLLHVAATNRPYLTNLSPYESVGLSETDESSDNITYTVMLSDDEESSGSQSDDESESPMDKLESLLAELKDVYDIDVEALQKAQKVEADAAEEKKAEDKAEAKKEDKPAEGKSEAKKEEVKVEDKKEEKKEVEVKEKEAVAASEDSDLDELVSKLSDVLKTANPDLVSLSNSEVTISDLANGVIELSNSYNSMKDTVGALNRKSAEADVDDAVRVGKILPAQRDAMVELKLSNEDMYDRLLPEQAIVSLSNEEGISVHDAGNNGKPVDEIASEIERLTSKFSK